MKTFSFMHQLGLSLLVMAIMGISDFDIEIGTPEVRAETDEPTELDGIEDPVAHWSFQGTSLYVLTDSSAHGMDGVIHGAKRVEDNGRAALQFDGKDDYVELSSRHRDNFTHLTELGQGTISIWFKLSSWPTGKQIYPIFYYGTESACDFFDAANKGLIVEVGHHPVQLNSMRLYYTMWAGGCTYPSLCFDSNFPMLTNTWYHFVVVVGESYNTGYLNGVQMIQRRYNFGSPFDSQFFENAVAHEAVWLGKGYWDSEVNFFHGLIGDVRIYAEPLTPRQVRDLHLATRTQLR